MGQKLKAIKDSCTTDSSGRRSRILPLVLASWIFISVKFLIGGMEIPGIGEQPLYDLYEYGTASMFIIATWVGREAVKKNEVKKEL